MRVDARRGLDCPYVSTLAVMDQAIERPSPRGGSADSGAPRTNHEAAAASTTSKLMGTWSSDCSEMAITNIPAELVGAIAAHLDLEDRVRLAATCRSLRAAVYSAPHLWREIEFCQRAGARITDTALGALLTQCSAHIRTTKLSLMHCTQVTGSGLAPLSGSSTLREIELFTKSVQVHTHGPSGLNDIVVADILRSSVEGPAATVVRQRQQHCHEDQTCAMCDDVSCDYCERIQQCTDCNDNVCGYCSSTCEECDEVLCYNCRRIERCEECNGIFCSCCRRVERCEECNGMFCMYCRRMGWCEECNKSICPDCCKVTWCQVCNKHTCEDCRRVQWCHVCKKNVCDDCRSVQWCEVCNKNICDDCNRVDWCEVRGMSVCDKCSRAEWL
jgi:hypothetical protein